RHSFLRPLQFVVVFVGLAFVVAELEELDVASRDLREMHVLDELERALQLSAHVGAVVPGRRDADHRPLPGVLSADLRRRHVEAIAQPSDPRGDEAALLLERVRAVDVQLDDRRPDDHVSAGRVSTISKGSITSPTLTSLKPSSPTPHSKPAWTSRTSSLKRFSDAKPPSQIC